MSAAKVGFLMEIGISEVNSGLYAEAWIEKQSGGELISHNPTTGERIAKVLQASEGEYEKVFQTAHRAYLEWGMVPAPKRGELVREVGDALRRHKEPLGNLVTLEIGKIKPDGL